MNLITMIELLAEHNLDANKIKVIVSREAASMIGTTANLKAGMILSLNELFYGMMLPSGNDAAFQIALVGGTIINLNR
jgi:serine-type D-Ala-D-Ala carboxypeptidase (penicillin-binding protein 5/6)